MANILKKQHPALHRCRCILGLEAKNPAVILPDADLDLEARECVTGALSFNGQRCTALKLMLVYRSVAEPFLDRLCDAVDGLKEGHPWHTGVELTSLPEWDKAKAMQAYVDDAVSLGAREVNRLGGTALETFYFPSVVYPVTPAMRLWKEEQFGPVVPVGGDDDLHEVLDSVATATYGQQAALFGQYIKVIGPLVDALANQVCRVNLNAQCQRGPDVYPFAGHKVSAEGTLSVSDALRAFSIRSMVATPE